MMWTQPWLVLGEQRTSVVPPAPGAHPPAQRPQPHPPLFVPVPLRLFQLQGLRFLRKETPPALPTMRQGGGHAIPPRPSTAPGCLGPPNWLGAGCAIPRHVGASTPSGLWCEQRGGVLLPQHPYPPRGQDPTSTPQPLCHSLECDGVLAAASLAGAHQVAGLPARLQPALCLSPRDGPMVPAVGGHRGDAKRWQSTSHTHTQPFPSPAAACGLALQLTAASPVPGQGPPAPRRHVQHPPASASWGSSSSGVGAAMAPPLWDAPSPRTGLGGREE